MKAIERIYQYIDFKGIKIAEFERKNFLSNGYLKKMLLRKGDLGESILNQIVENSPEISAEWLLTGKGEILKNKDQQMSNIEKSSVIGANVDVPGINSNQQELIDIIKKQQEQIGQLINILSNKLNIDY